ncbi:hypothetical protein DFH11DRAFT_207743 [Phellopilus nigrolimitatus]|nr:hypothetical protein DFH11DRAFT_207743 [Phellopilus nigrolimitatus]
MSSQSDPFESHIPQSDIHPAQPHRSQSIRFEHYGYTFATEETGFRRPESFGPSQESLAGGPDSRNPSRAQDLFGDESPSHSPIDPWAGSKVDLKGTNLRAELSEDFQRALSGEYIEHIDNQKPQEDPAASSNPPETGFCGTGYERLQGDLPHVLVDGAGPEGSQRDQYSRVLNLEAPKPVRLSRAPELSRAPSRLGFNDTGDPSRTPSPAGSHGAPSFACSCRESTPASSYRAPSTANSYRAPSPAGSYRAPSRADLHGAPPPVGSYRAPSPVCSCRAPFPVCSCRTPSPVCSCRAPFPVCSCIAPSRVDLHRAPPPVGSYKAPSPVGSYRAPSPVCSCRASSPVGSHRAPSPARSSRAPSCASSASAHPYLFTDLPTARLPKPLLGEPEAAPAEPAPPKPTCADYRRAIEEMIKPYRLKFKCKQSKKAEFHFQKDNGRAVWTRPWTAETIERSYLERDPASETEARMYLCKERGSDEITALEKLHTELESRGLHEYEQH